MWMHKLYNKFFGKQKRLFEALQEEFYIGIEEMASRIVGLEEKLLDAEQRNEALGKQLQEMLKQNTGDIDSCKAVGQYCCDTLADQAYQIMQLRGKTELPVRKLQIQMGYLYQESGMKHISQVIQWVPVLREGDGIGNIVLGFKELLDKNNIKNEIWALDILSDSLNNMAKLYSYTMIPDRNDVILFHMGGGSYMADIIEAYHSKKVLVYHNITPPCFLMGYDEEERASLEMGISQLKSIIPVMDYTMTFSEYSLNDLRSYNKDIRGSMILPVIRYDVFKLEADKTILKRYKDDIVNILFVGRIASNKKIEDLIDTAESYCRKYRRKTRLFLVGSYDAEDLYYQEICRKIEGGYGSVEIILTGHVTDRELNAYYKIADIFLCMSEHEGFGIPLIESMYFNVPIIAYDAAAVPDTLGGSGILVGSKDFTEIAIKIERLVSDETYRKRVVESQQKRLEYFSEDNMEKIFIDSIKYVMDQISCNI